MSKKNKKSKKIQFGKEPVLTLPGGHILKVTVSGGGAGGYICGSKGAYFKLNPDTTASDSISQTKEFFEGPDITGSFVGSFDLSELPDGLDVAPVCDEREIVDFSELPDAAALAPVGELNRQCLAQLRQCVRKFPQGVEAGDVICKGYRDLLIEHGLLERIDGLAFATPYGALCATANEGVFDGNCSYLDGKNKHVNVASVEHLITELLKADHVLIRCPSNSVVYEPYKADFDAAYDGIVSLVEKLSR